MKTLPKGANAPLAGGAGLARVELRWEPARGALDAVCLGVTEEGRVPDDDWIVFYNQLQAPGGVIRLTATGAGRADFQVRLESLPARIQRCVFAAVLEQGQFRDLTGSRLNVSVEPGEPLEFTLSEATDEQALIFAEIYRHGTGWKVRAIGQGFRGGLKPLAEHFGVEVGDALPAAPPLQAEPPRPIPIGPLPDPPTIDPAPPPDPASGRARPRSTGKWFALFALLLVGAGAVWYYNPAWLTDPALLWHDSRRLVQRLPVVYQPLSCDWTDEQVFERYHALGESYIKILQRVDQGNQRLAGFRQQLTQIEARCPDAVLEQSRREVEQLEKLPVGDWMDEATQLNACASLIIKRLESELSDESRPIIIQRLVREADRARNLESDLTNIARDLAYLRNKTGRLIEGFKEVIDACPQ